MLTQERLKELFSYDNGNLLYKNKGLRTKIGDVAGWSNGNGYIRIDVDGKKYYAHRLIWIYHNGQFEDEIIDHIDGDKTNNKIENLRLSDKSSNGLNRHRARSDSNSKMIGVISGKTKKGTNTFTARLTIKGEKFHLGNYKTALDAHNAYVEAKKKFVIF